MSDTTSQWADIKKYEDILARNPQSYCFAPLAELYRRLGLLEDALSTARHGCDIHPDYAAGQMAFAMALLESGDRHGALPALERVVRVTPDNLDAQRLLSQMYIESGHYAAAATALDIILSLAPNDTESRLVYESLPRNEVPEWSESLAAPDELPVSPGWAEGAGAYADFSSDEEEILELTEEVFDDDVESVFAGEESLHAPDIEPDVPLATATMAELYAQQGFNRQAIDIYQDLLVKEPSNATIRTRLEELGGGAVDAVDQQIASGEADTFVSAEISDETMAPQNRGLLSTLEQWLDNVRRVKACRSNRA